MVEIKYVSSAEMDQIWKEAGLEPISRDAYGDIIPPEPTSPSAESFGRDVSTHELALVEIKRLSNINTGLVRDFNTLLINGVRRDERLEADAALVFRHKADAERLAKENRELKEQILRMYRAKFIGGIHGS